MQNYRFSGHETFHCKQQWIYKGLQITECEGSANILKTDEAISELGVGKNMVRSIHHWLRSFYLLDEHDQITELAKEVFLKDGYDPYLENDGSLWLLQYFICKNKFASIYHLIFAEYFLDKANLEFSESQIVSYIQRHLKNEEQREVSENTLSSDFKVFVKSYLPPNKNLKTVEDDFNATLIELGLISDTGRINNKRETVYRINRTLREGISIKIVAFCILDYFGDKEVISFKEIRDSIGAFLCFSNEGLEQVIEKICETYPTFVYKDDAGVRQLQLKLEKEEMKLDLLNEHYKKKHHEL